MPVRVSVENEPQYRPAQSETAGNQERCVPVEVEDRPRDQRRRQDRSERRAEVEHARRDAALVGREPEGVPDTYFAIFTLISEKSLRVWGIDIVCRDCLAIRRLSRFRELVKRATRQPVKRGRGEYLVRGIGQGGTFLMGA